MYTTTFPCHDCAKHIVASGIRRVIYIEPYPKSLVPELYPDSIAVDGPVAESEQVIFDPFVGIAPRRYMELFEMVKRKDNDGKVTVWEKSKSIPRLGMASILYLVNEEA